MSLGRDNTSTPTTTTTSTAPRTATAPAPQPRPRPHQHHNRDHDSTCNATRSGTNGLFDRDSTRIRHRTANSTAPRPSPASADALRTARVCLPRAFLARRPRPQQHRRLSTETHDTIPVERAVAPTVAGRPPLIRLVHRGLHAPPQIPPGGTERGRRSRERSERDVGELRSPESRPLPDAPSTGLNESRRAGSREGSAQEVPEGSRRRGLSPHVVRDRLD